MTNDINRKLDVQFSTSEVGGVSALSSVVIGAVGTASDGVIAQLYEVSSLEDALAIVGNSVSKGESLPHILRELYRLNPTLTCKFAISAILAFGVGSGTIDTTAALAAGTKVVDLGSGEGTNFSVGDPVQVSNTTKGTIEIQRIDSKSTDEITFRDGLENAIDISDVVTLKEISQPDATANQNAYQALQNELDIQHVCLDLPVGELAALKTHLDTLESDEKFRKVYMGTYKAELAATAVSEAKTMATSADHKRIIVAGGHLIDADTGYKLNGYVTAAALMAKVVNQQINLALQNKAIISMNDLLIMGSSGYTALTNAQLNDLVNNGVTPLKVTSSGLIKIYQAVTSYLTNSDSEADDIFSNISSIMIDDYLAIDLSDKYDTFSSELTLAGQPLVNTDTGRKKVKAYIEGVLQTYDFFDGEYSVIVTSTDSTAIKITVNFKAVEPINRVTLSLVKRIV